MPHPADPADSLAPVDPAAHATHDTLLVAAFAAGDATGAELETAVALVAGCPGCAALHGDLRLIAAALPAMPTPRRSRDFRLTAGQAASLRPAGWRRLLAPFAGPRFAFAAPLGSGLAALGLAGLLLAGTGLPLGGSSAGAGSESGTDTASGAAAAPVPARAAPSPGMMVTTQGATAAPGVPDASTDPRLMALPAAQPSAGKGPEDTAAPQDTAVAGAAAPGMPVLLLASLAGLFAGAALVLLRLAGRSVARTH